jgi:long-chain fatty acid transport protein
MRKRIFALSLFGLVSCLGNLYGSGFAVNEHSIGAMSMGLAVTARLDNASTNWYNPAGLGFLDGLDIYLGGTFIIPFFKYSDPEGMRPSAENTSKLTFVPNFHMHYRINDMFAVGFSLAAPYGLTSSLPNDWAGSSVIQKVVLQTIGLYPTFTIRPHKIVSIGISPVFMFGILELRRGLGLADVDGTINGQLGIGGDGFGVGANIGIQVRPFDGFYLGFMYRSRIKLKFKGTAEFMVPTVNAYDLPDQDISLSIMLPDRCLLGIGYDILKNLYISADVEIFFWSLFNKIEIQFKEPLTVPSGRKSEEVIEENWKNSWGLRSGIQWIIKDMVPIRAGIGFDWSPVPNNTLSPILPDSGRLYVTFGAGYQHKKSGFYFDVGYLFVKWLSVSVSKDESTLHFPQKYNNSAHLVGLNIGWRFFQKQ